MRYARGHKEEVRRAILEKASVRFREDGIGATGIKTLMGDAGLTHGGFYAHFSSRDAIVSDASEEGVRASLAFLRRLVAKAGAGGPLEAVITGYLSKEHLADMGGGCAGAALAPEIARQPEQTRRRFMAGMMLIAEFLADFLPEGGEEQERLRRAFALYALMQGALQLARVALDQNTGDMILEGAKANALLLVRTPWPEMD